MVVTRAVYQLSEIQRGSAADARRQSARPTLTASSAARPHSHGTDPLAHPDIPATEIQTLREMLYQHFVEEVRKRDRNGDGLLSPREYGGTSDDFQAVDLDGDGLVSAKDLTRAALERSPELKQIIAGPWTPIYEAILRVKEPTAANLRRAVHVEAASVDTVACEESESPLHLKHSDRVSDTETPDSPLSKSTSGRIEAAFMRQNPSLPKLYDRLQNFVERLGRVRRHHHIDLQA